MDAKIQEIRTALEAATPGPWAWEGRNTESGVVYQHVTAVGKDNPNIGEGICNTFHYEEIACEWNGEKGVIPAQVGKKGNAHLIANAPTYISYLLQQIEIKDKAQKEIHKRIEHLANQPIAVFGEGFGWEEHYKWLKKDLRALYNNLPKGEDTP